MHRYYKASGYFKCILDIFLTKEKFENYLEKTQKHSVLEISDQTNHNAIEF